MVVPIASPPAYAAAEPKSVAPVAISVLDVWKGFPPGVDVLKGASLQLLRGGLIVIEGRTGAGKSTLFRTIIGAERPESGRIVVGGVEVTGKAVDLAAVRRSIGLMVQGMPLLPRMTVGENIDLALRAAKVPLRERRFRIYEALKSVGLETRRDVFPSGLSGGEMQRVCLARALAARPALALIDEPTALLDDLAAAAVIRTLREVHAKGVSLLVATHDRDLAEQLGARRLLLEGGRIHEAGRGADPP